jgi:hypothetical protein
MNVPEVRKFFNNPAEKLAKFFQLTGYKAQDSAGNLLSAWMDS